LKIYDFSSSTLVAQISGHYDPDTLPPAVTVESGNAFIIFNSNGSVTGKGWEIYYPKSTEGVPETNGSAAMQVFPNPASEMVTVSLSSGRDCSGTLKIISTTGSTIQSFPVNIQTGRSRTSIDVTQFPSGIYFLLFTGNNFNGTAKFVKL